VLARCAPHGPSTHQRTTSSAPASVRIIQRPRLGLPLPLLGHPRRQDLRSLLQRLWRHWRGCGALSPPQRQDRDDPADNREARAEDPAQLLAFSTLWVKITTASSTNPLISATRPITLATFSHRSPCR